MYIILCYLVKKRKITIECNTYNPGFKGLIFRPSLNEYGLYVLEDDTSDL